MDYFITNDRVMVAQVPTHRVPTVYAAVGDLFGWLAVAGFVFIAGWAIIRGRKTRAETASSPESQAPSA
jgi:apolipoprotein N-acyltransferase